MKLAGTERMQWFPACVAFTLSTKKSPTNRIWPPLGDWPLRPNYVRYRNVWYLVGKIIHRAIFSQKLKFLPWSSDVLLAIKVPAGEKDPPPGFQRSKKPGAHRVKAIFSNIAQCIFSQLIVVAQCDIVNITVAHLIFRCLVRWKFRVKSSLKQPHELTSSSCLFKIALTNM